MFGSKNSELTRKYSSTWLEAITFGFSSSSRAWYSQKPIAVNASASAEQHEQADAQPPLASTRGRAAGRTAARTGRRRTRPARAPWRCRPSRPTAARRARRRPTSSHSSAPLERCGTKRSGCRSRGTRPRQRAGADDHVERDEQVRGRAAGLDRDPERQRRRAPAPPAAPGQRAISQRERGDGDQADGAGREREARAVAHRVDLRRVPDLADQQHRREHQRAEHRRAPGRAARARAPPRPPGRRRR